MRAKNEKQKPRLARIGAAHFPAARLAASPRSLGRMFAPRLVVRLALAAALVALAAPLRPARAFQLFPRESAASADESASSSLLDPAAAFVPEDACACAPHHPHPREAVDRGRQPLGPHAGVGATAAIRRVLDRALRRAKEGWRGATTRASAAEASENKKPGGADADACADAAHAERHFADVVDALGDLERELFLAAPAGGAFPGPARHEPPLASALRLARGDLFPAFHFPFPALLPARREERRRAPEETPASSPSALLAALHRSAMDVRETPDAFVFVADVPGTKREDVEVEVDEAERTLTVRGRREETVEVGEDEAEEAKEEKKTEEKNADAAKTTASSSSTPADARNARPRHLVRERHFGSFENRYALPRNAALDEIKAETAEGVLTVTVPKRKGEEPPRARRVQIETRER